MFLRMIYDDKLAQAAYMIGCQKTGEALVIDPERDVERYIEIAAENRLRITAISETHIHADFLSGARELAERTGAKLYLSGEGGPDWQYQWLDKKVDGGNYDYQLLHNGDRFRVGNIEIEAVHTPGHTPEHLSYLVTDLGSGITEPIGIATGDFVFVGDVGRPDLLETAAGHVGEKEPSARTLYNSLQGFVQLPDYLQVWPGHGAGSACGKALGAIPQSTVGYEKRFNGAIVEAQGDDQDLFVQSILDGQPDPPMYFARMKKENRDGPAVLGGTPVPKQISVTDMAERAANDENVVILDSRSWEEYRKHHLQGSLYVPMNKTYPTVAGSYVEPEQDIYLVADEDDIHDAVLNLIRIGLDNIAGYVTPQDLSHYLHSRGQVRTIADIEAEELEQLYRTGSPYILDVRNIGEYETSHVSGAQNAPHTRLPAYVGELPKDHRIYVHCLSGARSAVAAAFLQEKGYDIVYLDGSYADLVQSGLPTASGPARKESPVEA